MKGRVYTSHGRLGLFLDITRCLSNFQQKNVEDEQMHSAPSKMNSFNLLLTNGSCHKKLVMSPHNDSAMRSMKPLSPRWVLHLQDHSANEQHDTGC